MKCFVFLVLLLSVNGLSAMSPEKSSRWALIPYVEPESSRAFSRGCFRCYLPLESFAQQQEKDVVSQDQSVLEESFICATHRIRDNHVSPQKELLTRIENNRWQIFTSYVQRFWSGDTQSAVKILEAQYNGIHSDMSKRRKCLLTEICRLSKEAHLLESTPN